MRMKITTILSTITIIVGLFFIVKFTGVYKPFKSTVTGSATNQQAALSPPQSSPEAQADGDKIEAGHPRGNEVTKSDKEKSASRLGAILALRQVESVDYRELNVDADFSKAYQGNRELLNLFDEGNQFSSWKNPKSDQILVNHDGWRNHWKICDKEGNILCEVPGGVIVDQKPFGAAYWLWKGDNSLVGSMYHDAYPDDDYDEADGAKLFLFQIDKNDRMGTTSEIKTPSVKKNHVVRIEGITPEGYLILSDVITNKYYPSGKFIYGETDYRSDEKFLGVFEIIVR